MKGGALVLLLVLLSGCATPRYEALRAEFDAGAETPYLQAVLAESATTEDALAEVAATVAESKQRWEQALAAVAVPKAKAKAKPEPTGALAGLVESGNPGVMAAAESLRAVREKYPQAVALDTVLQQYNAFTKELATKVGPHSHQEMMAMSFPFPDALALKGKLVSEEEQIARQQYEIALRDAITEARVAYHDLAYVRSALTVNREQQALLEQMIAVAQTKMRTGKASYQALIMAQVELAKLVDGIITLEEQLETVAARVNTLLGRLPDAALPAPAPAVTEAFELGLEEAYAAAVERRQELQVQRLRIVRMETMVELATRMANPDASQGASYLETRMGRESTFMTQRALSHAQTPWFGQRDAYIREVKVQTTALRRTLASMEDQTRLAVKKAHFTLDTAQRSLALYRDTLLPQAEQSLEAAVAGYRAAKTDFLTFLDAERTLLKFRLEEQAALRDQRIAKAKLSQLIGGKQ